MESESVGTGRHDAGLDDAEVERFARAIVRVWHGLREEDGERARRVGNTYATAFQFLVLRRGADYGRELGQAAEARALAELAAEEGTDTLSVTVAEIHERVCRETI